MAPLFASCDPSVWRLYLSQYPEAFRIRLEAKFSKSKDPEEERREISDIEEWLRTEYRGPLDKAKLEKVMRWKLGKGTFRPGLLQKAQSNSEDAIREAWLLSSQQLLGDPPEVQAAIKALGAGLFGVGPATATALLAPLVPEVVPFMSDEGMLGCGLFKEPRDLKYDAKTCATYCHMLSAKAAELGKDWTAELVQQALFAERVLAAAGTSLPSSVGKGSLPKSKLERKERLGVTDAMLAGAAKRGGVSKSSGVKKSILKKPGVA